MKQKESRKHGVPAIFSFFMPGLGQIIKGEVLKGICIFGLYLILAVFTVFLVFSLSLFCLVTSISGLVLYIWNIYDAYNC